VLQAAARGIGPALVARAQAVDDGMHATVVDALGNAIVADAYRVNALKIRLIRQAQTRLRGDLVAPVMHRHLAIIAALRTRDPARAEAAIAAHINEARDRALGVEPVPPRPGRPSTREEP
jgi:DNA-binding GntR family transcriptional regulator